MKKMNENVVVFWFILGSFSSFVWAENSSFQIVESNRVPEILEMLASATQDNYEKIQTWEGHIAIESISSIRGRRASEILTEIADAKPDDSINEIHQSGKQTREFKIDLETNRYFSRSATTEPDIFQCPKSKATYLPTTWKPEDRIQIITSDHQFSIHPLTWRNDTVIQRQANKNIHMSIHQIDPLRKFNVGGKQPWVSLSQLSRSLRWYSFRSFGVVLKVKTEGEHTVYRLEVSDPGKKEPFNVVLFSSEVGFNRTYIENRHDDGSLASEITTEFVNLDGVFLPKRWTVAQYYSDGGLIQQRTGTVVHQKINIPVGDDVFSELTYLQDNDRYQDRTRGKTYTVQSGKLVEEER